MSSIIAFSGTPSRVETDINNWQRNHGYNVVSVSTVVEPVSTGSVGVARGNIMVVITYNVQD